MDGHDKSGILHVGYFLTFTTVDTFLSPLYLEQLSSGSAAIKLHGPSVIKEQRFKNSVIARTENSWCRFFWECSLA